MSHIISFTIVSELTTSDDAGAVSLTKKLNIWQLLTAKWMDNIRIQRIRMTYEPRVGDLGEGDVTAQIIDNRIEEDIDNNVLREVTFHVSQKMRLTWEHDVSLHIDDLKSPNGEGPIILRTSVSGCNMKARYSLGQIRIIVEIAMSSKMIRSKTKDASVRLSPIPQRKEAGRCIEIEKTKQKILKPASMLSIDMPSKELIRSRHV